VLVVMDEAPGVRSEIYQAVEGISAGGDVHILALGNPVIAGGPFFEAFSTDRGRWHTITIDAFDTPNLRGLSLEELRELPPDLPETDKIFSVPVPRPYLITRRWVAEALWKYGEESVFWQARVRGEFPIQAEDAVFRLRWIENAVALAAPIIHEKLVAGLDVAGSNAGDETALTVRGLASSNIYTTSGWRVEDSRGQVAHALKELGGPDRFESVNVDFPGHRSLFRPPPRGSWLPCRAH